MISAFASTVVRESIYQILGSRVERDSADNLIARQGAILIAFSQSG
jgi:hypothetical protein